MFQNSIPPLGAKLIVRAGSALAALFLITLTSAGCIGISSLKDSGLFGDKEGDTTPQTGAALIALGGSGTPGPGTPVGGGAAGPGGTTITSTDNMFRIIIPEGAMHDQQKFTITRYVAATSALPGGFIPTTPIYQITPSYRFKKDVTAIVTLDTSRIQSLNLQKLKSSGFAITQTAPDTDSQVISGWSARSSRVEGDTLVMTTRTFSLFGGASPPAGNSPPNIQGAFYYFKPNTTFLPHRVRARVTEPDGDTMQVYLITGPVGGGTNVIAMAPDGGNWYRADIPYEAMVAGGIQMQIMAIDQYGANATVPPDRIFSYPADSGNTNYINNYTRDQDGDGYLDAWEIDNGFDPRNPADPPAAGNPDTDGDGIPDSSDHTPNGEPNPVIDALAVIPSNVQMDISETVAFGVQATLGGQPRFVNPAFVTTGNALNGSPVGALTGALFLANNPGAAGVVASVGPRNDTASVTVSDTVGPNAISDLTAVPSSANVVRLRWTAPGNDGSAGRASAYEIRRSTSPISDDTTCNAGSPIAHGLIPKTAGLPEILDLSGHAASTLYYYCVRAYDSNGNRNIWTANVSTTTSSAPDAIPPADITGVAATPSGTNRIQLAWTAVGDDGMTGTAQAYEIRYATTPINSDGDCDSGVVVPNNVTGAAGSPVSFLVSGLSENTTYFFCVRANDASGNRSSWNGVLTAATPIVNIPPIMSATAEPTKMVTLPLTLDGTASIDPDSIGCGANTGNYQIAWTVISKPITSNVTDGGITNADALSATVVLDVAGSYTFQLLFTDDSGTCGGGDRAGLTTVNVTGLAQDLTPPGDITTLNAVPASTDQINLTWTAVGDDGLTGLPLQYEVGVSQLPITNETECVAATDKRIPPTIPASGSPMAYSVVGLNQNQTYHFCVRAFDEVGQHGIWTGAVLATTMQGTAGWGPWSAWSTCDKLCGGGVQTRTRNCDNPGLGCLGNNTDSAACNTQQCQLIGVSAGTWGGGVSTSCPGTHQLEKVFCQRGHNWRADFDYWCPICACGIIQRWAGYVYTSETGKSSSGNTGSCSFSSGVPIPPAPCQFTSQPYQNRITLHCRQLP